MQRVLLRFWLLVLTALAAVSPSQSWAVESPEISNLQEQLKAAETAFAKTMADRDPTAFAAFLAEEAIFFGPNGALRGKTAVVDAWKKFFDGKQAPFSWRPDTAVVLDSGTLGLTSGPVFDPEGKQFGTFQTTWRRTTDGRWEVVFDKGGAYCPEK